MRYLFIINPVAGKGTMQREIEENIKSFFEKTDASYAIHYTTGSGDAKAFAREQASVGDDIRIFACGGEGTVFDVLNGIVGFENVELGVIPCGSANDFLKFFKTKKEFFDIEDQFNAVSIKTDLIKANEYYCLNGCSVGMDAMVAHDMSIFKNWPLVTGSLAYKLAVVKTFLKPLGIKMKLSLDSNEPTFVNCLFAVIANAPYYGGGYMAAPDAVPYDNKLDFTLVNTISKLKVPKFLGAYEKGEHAKFDYCEMKNASIMEFWADEKIPVNLDGEIIEEKHVRFEIVKSALKFLIPKSVAERLNLKIAVPLT